MKIAITGSHGLAGRIIETLDAVPLRVENLLANDHYLEEALEKDVFINCAHISFKQTWLLNLFFDGWRNLANKHIINISSRAAKANISKGYLYSAQKAALNHLADNLIYNSDKQCKISTINIGLMESKLPSLSYDEIVEVIEYILMTDIEIAEITIQHPENYQKSQDTKKIMSEQGRVWKST